MNPVNRATAIGFISIVLWGMLALFTSLTNGKIPPFQMLAMTFSASFFLMLVNWWRQGKSGLEYARQPWLAWTIGLGGLFGYHALYFLAMSKAPPVQASLIAYLWPLFIVLFSALLPGERLTKYSIIGAIIALTGCWILVGGGSGHFSTQYLVGYLAAFACAIWWAAYSVASRFVKNVPTDAVGWFCGATAVLGLICHLLFEQTVWPADYLEWLGLLGLGFGSIGISFFTWDYGVKHGNIQLLGVLSYAAPLISVVLLMLAGKAEPSLNVLIACAAIVGGAVLASQSNRTQYSLKANKSNE
ncbi:Permease of the drug/metabolite transporter (DMT) superfamily [Thiothrix eikelboomii]|uniref:Permease of the drug/metabolite transporter (DMT) superfamily n=1 Tax=Thiothrix eikelboomii TaxID=92487 RepID=A0A1T4XTT3_9GAMM|nr:EamA family transporter [Thiothrix eikelboomii]SKA92966.1 Permease of the drug/metabolite transporter (DMT) superfamily [Thiothrix eikelboomii]